MASLIPQPMDTDTEDVHWALTTATSLQAQGDNAEALRWLRKAVSAAVASDNDTRAIQLGRCAATLEASLGAAATQRGNLQNRLNAINQLSGHAPVDADTFDLDQPTFVDSTARTMVLEEDTVISSTDGDITLVPFTQKTDSGARHTPPPPAARQPRPPAASPRAQTLQVDQFPPSYVEVGEESTRAMRRAPNHQEISDFDSVAEPSSRTAHALAPVPQHRVALLASPDGHDPRVMLLRPGMEAPASAGVATLTPVTSRDADVIAQLLASKRKR